MEGNQTCVIEFSHSDIKMLMTGAFPESTKKSPKYALSLKAKKVKSRLLKLSLSHFIK